MSYFTAGFDPIRLEPNSKDTREKGWNDPNRPPSEPAKDGNIGLRTGVVGTAPNGILVDVDDDVAEAATVSDLLFPPTGAIFGRSSKPRSHRMYVCTGDVPPAIKLNGLGGDDDTICELRTRTKEGKALQTVVPPSIHQSGEGVSFDTPTFSPSPADCAFLVRATYLKATAVLLARHLPRRGHDYRLALAGFLKRLGFDDQEMLQTGLAIIKLVDGNEQDWRTICRSTSYRGNQPLAQNLGAFVDDVQVVRHVLGWFGIKQYEQRGLVITSAADIEMESVEWLWADYIPLGKFGLHSGREGLGKTLTALEKAALITRGKLDGCYFAIPKRVLIAATEDDWSTTIVPRLKAADADLDLVGRIEVTVGDSLQDLSLPADIEALKQYLSDSGDVAMVILDPLLSRLDGKLDTHVDAKVRIALEPLVRLAQETNTTVWGIIHVNKTQTADPLNAIMGSRAFVAVSRFVFATVQDPNDESVMLLGQVKCNVGAAKRDTHAYSIKSVTVGTDRHGKKVEAPQVQWMGTSQRSIRAVLEEQQNKAVSQRKADNASAAQVWLVDFLSQQPNRTADTKTIIALGASAGHSERKLRTAAVLLKIKITQRNTFPRTSEWTLTQAVTF